MYCCSSLDLRARLNFRRISDQVIAVTFFANDSKADVFGTLCGISVSGDQATYTVCHTLTNGGEYHYLISGQSDFTITKRTAPRRPPSTQSYTTTTINYRNGTPFYHYAYVDERGRIDVTKTIQLPRPDPAYVYIGNSYAFGYNNKVLFYGMSDGTCTRGYATCRGDWWVNPCNWTSGCSTGWEWLQADFYPVSSQYCGGCN